MGDEVAYVIQKRTKPDGTVIREVFVPAKQDDCAPVLFGKWPDYIRMKNIDQTTTKAAGEDGG